MPPLSPNHATVHMTKQEWDDLAESRFGLDPLNWKFVCPACGHVASVRDWRDAGAPQSAIAFSCVGRWLKGVKVREAFGGKGPGPCNYAGGGLFRLNPVKIGDRPYNFFYFYDPTSGKANERSEGW